MNRTPTVMGFWDGWIMTYPDNTIETGQIVYKHGRHRFVSNHHIHLSAGGWWRPGKWGWELIDEDQCDQRKRGTPRHRARKPHL